MCSSPRHPTKHRHRMDWADCLGSLSGAGGLIVLAGLTLLWLWSRPLAAASGEVQLMPEPALRVSLVPMPEMAVPGPERVEAVRPKPEADSAPHEEPLVERPPPPRKEPVSAEVPPPVEAAPAEAAQHPVKEEGAAGKEEAIRTEWLIQLRHRIEQSKFYPGGARVSRETGTVMLQVEILPSAEIGRVRILENTGSALLAEGAVAILRRAAETPLGTNLLSGAFQVEVPITYQARRR